MAYHLRKYLETHIYFSCQDELQAKAEFLQLKLQRAAMLVDGLAGEKLRWEQTVEYCNVHYSQLPGDCLLATAFLSYVGPFVSQYREYLLQLWKKSVEENEEVNKVIFWRKVLICMQK